MPNAPPESTPQEGNVTTLDTFQSFLRDTVLETQPKTRTQVDPLDLVKIFHIHELLYLNLQDKIPVTKWMSRLRDNDVQYLTAFHLAVIAGSVQRMTEFVKKGRIDVNLSTPNSAAGIKSVHLAAIFGRNAVLLRLKKLGADWLATSGSGLNTMHFAAFNNQLETVKLLLKASKDCAMERDASFRIPLDYARISSQEKDERVFSTLAKHSEKKLSSSALKRAKSLNLHADSENLRTPAESLSPRTLPFGALRRMLQDELVTKLSDVARKDAVDDDSRASSPGIIEDNTYSRIVPPHMLNRVSAPAHLHPLEISTIGLARTNSGLSRNSAEDVLKPAANNMNNTRSQEANSMKPSSGRLRLPSGLTLHTLVARSVAADNVVWTSLLWHLFADNQQHLETMRYRLLALYPSDREKTLQLVLEWFRSHHKLGDAGSLHALCQALASCGQDLVATKLRYVFEECETGLTIQL